MFLLRTARTLVTCGVGSTRNALARRFSSKVTPKITRISVYQVDLPHRDGGIKYAKGTSVEVFDSTVVRIETNAGVEGWGENCPFGLAYQPEYAKGIRTGIQELGPSLLGQDPTKILGINQVMDNVLNGHAYVKSAIDIACWDILGKVSGLPVCHLLGGRFGDSCPLYSMISQDTPERMRESVCRYRAEGYKTFQMKIGSNVEEDIDRVRAAGSILERGELIMADANTSWQTHEAIRFIHGVKDLKCALYIEQPCQTYEECLSIRRMCPMPLILDESMNSIGTVVRIFNDNAADAIKLKISKVGGLTGARQIRDLCLHLGISVIIEDAWGGDIATSAVIHLAHSTLPASLFATIELNSYQTVVTADGVPKPEGGRISAPSGPGLGVAPRMDVLGEPVYVIE